jgi:hypothetical protein
MSVSLISKFVFTALFSGFVLTNVANGYEYIIPMPIAGYEKLQWKMSKADSKLMFPKMTCMPTDSIGFDNCSIQSDSKVKPMIDDIKLKFYKDKLCWASVGYIYEDNISFSKKMDELVSYYRNMDDSEINTIKTPITTSYEIDMSFSKVLINSDKNNITLDISCSYMPFVNGKVTKYRSETPLKELVEYAGWQESIPREPVMKYKNASKFDSNRSGIYQFDLSYANKEEYNKIPSNNMHFTLYKRGLNYYIGASVWSALKSAYSLELIVDDDKITKLEKESFDDNLSTFRIDLATLKKISSAKNVDFRFGYREYIAQEFKEGFFTQPIYVEGVFGDKRIQWVGKFLIETSKDISN